MKTRTIFLIICSLFLSFPVVAKADFPAWSAADEFVDNDGDGYFADEDCDDSNAVLNETCPLLAYTDCTNINRFDSQCLPTVTGVEGMLQQLANLAMDPDRFAWDDYVDGSGQKISPSRPSDDPFAYMGWLDFWSAFGSILDRPWEVTHKSLEIFFDFFGFDGGWNFWPPVKYLDSFQMAKKHLQSIQYIDKGPYTNNVPFRRYLVTSISDETEYASVKIDQAAIQLIQADNFGSEDGAKDKILTQRLLNADAEVAGYNHPGGSQLIGEYLFLALEDFDDPDGIGTNHWPSTGVWRIDRQNEEIEFLYAVLTEPDGEVVPLHDRHQATAAVTRLSDDTFLLAACVYKECDYINFYKSTGKTLATNPGFQLIGRWVRPKPDPADDDWWKEAWTEMPPEDNWSDCGPQNMNFTVQSGDGGIYLVMFGGEASNSLVCAALDGLKDSIYGYKVGINFSRQDGHLQYEIQFTHIANVRVIPGRFRNTKYNWKEPRSIVWMPNFHGLNLMAGSGLWLRPNGRDDIAFFATEHFDSARSYKRPVNADSRWGVSSNWDSQPQIWVDDYLVEVNEGSIAMNSGSYESGNAITLSATVGTVLKESEDLWSWSWLAKDGPDDSQMVTIRRTDVDGNSDSVNFDLVVRNVAPTADAGPDQVVECVHGNTVALDATGSSDPGDDTLSFAWAFSDVPGSSAPPFDDPNSATPSFLPNALGTYLAEVAVTDDDGASDADSVAILFEDTTPPVIASLGATPGVLWPPNGKMIGIEISVSVTDSCDLAPVCAISSITSNEPELDEPDSEITGSFTANLRAKRLGAGDGRIYTIAVGCSDYAGNSTTRTTAVIVPHDQEM